MAEPVLHMREVTSHITVKVKGLRSFGVRMKIAALAFRFGAWVAGVGIEIESGDGL